MIRQETLLFEKAIKAHQQNDFETAKKLYHEVLQLEPNHIDSLHLLGVIYGQQEKNIESVNFLEKAVKLNPNNPMFLNNYAEALKRNGELEKSLATFNKCISIEPKFIDAYANRANVLKELNRYEEAHQDYLKAINGNPNNFKYYYNFGNNLIAQGMYRFAIENFRKAISLNPNYVEGLNNLGVALQEYDELDEAIIYYKKALNLQPDFKEGKKNLAIALEIKGDSEELSKYLVEKSKNSTNNQKELELKKLTLFPTIPLSIYEINRYVSKLENKLDEFLDNNTKLDDNFIYEQDIKPPFILAYYPINNKPIKEKFAQLITNSISEYEKLNFNNDKPHIGFVVTKNHEGVFLKCMKGIINNLSTEKLKISIVYNEPNGKKIIEPSITNKEINYVALGKDIKDSVEILKKQKFDFLCYWEVNTDIINYLLPFYKPAKKQMALWGLPVTSGIAQIDYFWSGKMLETEKSKEHYTEKLFCVSTLPSFYYKPTINQTNYKSKTELGFNEKERLYLCSQNLRKITPYFDKILGDILKEDKEGKILLISDKQKEITNMLKYRLGVSQAEVADRIIFLPRMEEQEYLSMVANSDVILDTTNYSSGANTCYDAFAMGKPIITLPSNFHRSRYTYAAYQQLGLDSLIANSPEHYVQLAINTAKNKDLNLALGNEIKTKLNKIFEDITPVKELENFFLDNFF